MVQIHLKREIRRVEIKDLRNLIIGLYNNRIVDLNKPEKTDKIDKEAA